MYNNCMQREELRELAEILNSIYSGTISFHDANVLVQKKSFSPDRVKIDISYLGAVLRNSVSLLAIIENSFTRIPHKLRYILLVGLVAIRFSSDPEEKKQVRDLLEQEFRNVELENYLISLKNLLSQVETDGKLIPSYIQPNTAQYFSCLYNIPLSLFKMWVKQFGIHSAIKTSSSFSRRAPVVYRVNTNKTKVEDLLLNHQNGLKATDCPDLLNYVGKTSIRSNPVHKESLVFKTQKVVYNLVQQMDLAEKDTFIYIADESFVPLEIMLASQQQGGRGIDILVSTDIIKFPLLQKSNPVRNTKQYVRVSTFDGLEANLHKKYPNVVFVPKSTKFDDISSRPELLIQLDLDKLDALIENQLVGLKSVAEFVEEYGYLYYLVPTLSKKESSRVIRSFLQENPGFALASEKQFFPYEKGGATLYYAILKKEPAVNEEA